jgi:protein ImuB
MVFACIYIPDFWVQSVVRAEEELRGKGVALLSGTPPLWNVAAANPAALQAGIRLGMTKSQAADFGVQIRQRCEPQEKTAHAALLDVGWSVSPRVEDTAADTLVLDLEGLETLWGSVEKVAQELTRRVSNVGLVSRIAVARNIEVAIHAVRGFPGITVVAVGQERESLSSLPIDVLSTEQEIRNILERWGIATLGALAALPVLQLSERLGQEGVRLHALAGGAHQRSLVPAEPGSSFEEEMELDDSVEELEPLSFLLGRLLDQLCARLEARALAARAIHVRFELEPAFESAVSVREDESRKKSAAKEYCKVLTLPSPVRDSKMLLKLLRLQLQSDAPGSPIQKIVLRADSAAPRVMQNGLFTPCAPDPEKLELTLARLAKVVGDSNVGSAELVDTHGPENFRMKGFTAAPVRDGRRPRKRSGVEGENHRSITEFERKRSAGFRVMRPAVPANVRMQEERPARIWFRGMQGEIKAASGPWRSSGDWWEERVWDQDEWDLVVEFELAGGQSASGKNTFPLSGVYRIFYEAKSRSWFVRGFYD